MPNTVDPMAAVHAERTVRELLEPYEEIDADFAAKTLAEATEAHFEYRDGQRRLVLATAWEVDPAAHVGRAAA
ncbi:hypothetical protein [Micromonospora sp. C41]|uniref:hypothetical protein n=1 Tax=Micromonospora sp. C41 TaxID=2824878 RepID=UPI001B364ED4|nr:hypothetical protein [Micromonospora sp. C41]MBQ1064505.1 hypothetical protein [Micromonospora sp. C41]